MKTLNTLHLSSLAIWDLKGGKGRVSTYLPLKGRVDRGHKVRFVSSTNRVSTGDVDGISCKKIWTLNSLFRRSFVQFLLSPLNDLLFFVAGIKEARKNRPDIVYAHCVYTALAAYWVAKIYGAKCVIRLYGIGKSATNKWCHFPSYMMRKRSMLLKADAFILTNDGTAADKFAKSLGVPENKIFFLKNGIKKDVDLTPDENLRKEYTPNNEKIVISVSRLSNGKQVDLIIKMMPELLTMIPAKLLIIGDGGERENLHNLVEELGVTESVVFIGSKKQSEVFQYLNISDVFVSMNKLSSMSNPVFEAMICGKPVVALNKGTTSDMITDGENGLLIEDENLNELPLLVCRLLKDDDERRRIGQNARTYMLREFPTWEERVRQELDVIENL